MNDNRDIAAIYTVQANRAARVAMFGVGTSALCLWASGLQTRAQPAA